MGVSGLHYVMPLWFELCDCLCMPLLFIYARLYDISIGHYAWFVVACNDLSRSIRLTSLRGNTAHISTFVSHMYMLYVFNINKIE
jgi:hypothetical protein